MALRCMFGKGSIMSYSFKQSPAASKKCSAKRPSATPTSIAVENGPKRKRCGK